MKARFFYVFLFFAVCFNTLTAQQLKEEELPPGLVYEFKNRYPGVDKVEWTYQKGYYFADFIFMGNTVMAQYEKSTKWIKAETNIKNELLPKNISKYVSSQFPDQKIQNTKLIEKQGESAYYRVQSLELNETRILFFDNDFVFQRMTDPLGNDIVTGEINNAPGTQPISVKELPSPVNSFVSMEYTNFRIANSYLVNNTEWENTYYVILSSNLAKEKVQLWFDFKGNLVKKIDPNEVVPVEDVTNTNTKKGKKKTGDLPKSLSEDQIPAAVKTTFNKQVKKHEKLTWNMVRGNYVASYFEPIRRYNCRSEFAPTGAWIQTFTEQDTKNLNPNISKHLNENYPDLKIFSAESVNTSARKRYILVKIYNPRWENDPMVYHELYFAQSGRLENEIYASYSDPYDNYVDENKEKRNQDFLENVDSEDFTGYADYKKISPKELPTKAVNHSRNIYPDYRIAETYIMSDEDTGEIIYWIILKKEGVKARIKAIYGFKGNFIGEEEI